jgi:hypothetical protein
MKKFLFKISLIVFPVLTLLITVNYVGDAANLFSREYEKKIAQIISSGNYVTNISNYDERLVQEELIKNLGHNLDVVVIGSSRAMIINNEYFPEKKMMNNSVSGASLEDLIAIYQIYKISEKLPKKMVIGIDPWTFQVDKNRTRWESISKYYNLFHGQKEENKTFAYDQLFSLSYFQNSLKNIPDYISGNNQPLSTNQKKNKTRTILNDGSIVYGEKRRNVSVNAVDKSAQLWKSTGMIERYQYYNSLQPKWEEFEKLILDMRKNGINIELVLTPFYPTVYKEMIHNFPIINSIETKIKIFSRKNNLKFYGSFNPAKYGLNNDAFYDETHVKEFAMKKLFNP